MFKQKPLVTLSMLGALLVAPLAMAETHTVTAQGMAFNPLVIKVAPDNSSPADFSWPKTTPAAEAAGIGTD